MRCARHGSFAGRSSERYISQLFVGRLGAMWNPNDLATLYATDAATTRITGDGSTAGLMKAQLGNLHDASQSTAGSRPTYKTTPNRLVYGTDDALLFGDIFNDIFAGVDSQFSIVACIDGVPQSGLHVIISKFGDGSHGDNARQVYLGVSNGKLRFAVYFTLIATQYRVSDSTTSTGAGKTVVAATYDGSQDGNNGLDRFKFWFDGVSDTPTMALTAGAISDIPTSTAMSALGAAVGIAGTTISYDLTGDIGPILLINGVLSISEIAQINNYFMETWL